MSTSRGQSELFVSAVCVEREMKETLSLYLFLETVKTAINRTGPPGSAGNRSNAVRRRRGADRCACGPGGRGTQRARLVRKKPHRSLAKATCHAMPSSPNFILVLPLESLRPVLGRRSVQRELHPHRSAAYEGVHSNSTPTPRRHVVQGAQLGTWLTSWR